MKHYMKYQYDVYVLRMLYRHFSHTILIAALDSARVHGGHYRAKFIGTYGLNGVNLAFIVGQKLLTVKLVYAVFTFPGSIYI